jgi:hypothetical protein
MEASWLLLFSHTGSVMGRLIDLRNANLRGFFLTRDVALHACRTRKVATHGDNFMKKTPASGHQAQVTNQCDRPLCIGQALDQNRSPNRLGASVIFL